MEYKKVIIKTAEQAAAEEAEELEKRTCPNCGNTNGEYINTEARLGKPITVKCHECGTVWEIQDDLYERLCKQYEEFKKRIPKDCYIVEEKEPRKWWQFWKR